MGITGGEREQGSEQRRVNRYGATRRRKTQHICTTLKSWKNYILKWTRSIVGKMVRNTGRHQRLHSVTGVTQVSR